MTVNFAEDIEQIRSESDIVLVLPYRLSIVDHYQIFVAIDGRPVRMWSNSARTTLTFESVFDLYDFDRSIDEQAVTISINERNFIHWDDRERFVIVAGEASFCDAASPYPSDVRKHYFVEGSIIENTMESPEEVYRLLVKE